MRKYYKKYLQPYKSSKKRASSKELEALLNGEADGNDTFLEIHAGAGVQKVVIGQE